MFNNPLYDISSPNSEEVHAPQTVSLCGSSLSRQLLLTEQDSYSSSSSIPSSPWQSIASKTSFGWWSWWCLAPYLWKNKLNSLQEVRKPSDQHQGKNEQIAFMMDKITTLTGKWSAISSQNQQLSSRTRCKFRQWGYKRFTIEKQWSCKRLAIKNKWNDMLFSWMT